MKMTCRWCGRSMSRDGSFWNGGYCSARCRSHASANSKVTSWSLKMKPWLLAVVVIASLYQAWPEIGPYLHHAWPQLRLYVMDRLASLK
jgi:hypothetical protein